jgi:hypothetical protein
VAGHGVAQPRRPAARLGARPGAPMARGLDFDQRTRCLGPRSGASPGQPPCVRRTPAPAPGSAHPRPSSARRDARPGVPARGRGAPLGAAPPRLVPARLGHGVPGTPLLAARGPIALGPVPTSTRISLPRRGLAVARPGPCHCTAWPLRSAASARAAAVPLRSAARA